MRTRKYFYRYILLTVLACTSLLFASYFYKMNQNQIVTNRIRYTEKSNMDYKVYLKENEFFDQKYLTKKNINTGKKSLISEYIDEIEATFNYSLDFDYFVSGEYNYYIKAVVESNDKTGTSNYWSKEYVLTPINNKKVDKSKKISVSDTVKIKYDEYNNILNKFKTKTDVPMSGKLKLVLVIKSELGSEILTGKYPISNTLNIEINLGDKTSNVKIIDSEGTKNSELLESYKEKEKDFVKYRFGVVVFICITLVFIFLGVLVRKEEKKNNYFFIRLKSILRNYDHIIVNVDATVSTKNYNVIKVKSFEELLDVHSEVRLPIYYYYKREKATFSIIHDNMMWLYEFKNVKK